MYFNFFSDVEDTQIKANFNETSSENQMSSSNILFPSKFIWNKESAVHFQAALSDNEVQNMIKEYLNKDSTVKKDNISETDHALFRFNNILRTVCSKSLKKSHKNKTSKKDKAYKSKKWFDIDLHKMRSELHKKSKLYSKYPFDPILRGSFFKFRKQYNKLCKQKQREFKANIIKKS